MAEHVTVTPSGISIAFEDGEAGPDGKSKKRAYLVNGERLPSVTTVLQMLEKPGLVWWSEKLTASGCIELARDGSLPLALPAALGQLTRRGLRHFQVKEQKAQRGKVSHEDLVAVAAGRALRPLDEYEPEQRGFIRGVAKFLADFRPTIGDSEMMVASVKHRFAGRLDLRGTLGIRTLPDGSGPAPRGLGLLDLKSVDEFPRTKPSRTHPAGQLKTPYPENLLQLGLYEVGARECGYGATDWQAVVRVDSHGNYDFTVSWLEPERSTLLLPAYQLFRDAASRVKQPTDQQPVGLNLELEGVAA